MQVKYENQFSPISQQNIYTAGATDEIAQVNVCWESIGDVMAAITYVGKHGQRTLYPSNDFESHTIKIAAGSSILLDAKAEQLFGIYVVITPLWIL